VEKERNIGTLTLHGGNLCCNFINTVYAWRGENLHEYLGSYDDFIAWCRKVNAGNASTLNALQKKAAEHPEAAALALNNIKKLRRLLYEFISLIAAKDYAGVQRMLPQVNALIHKATSHTAFELKNESFMLNLAEDPGDLQSPLWIIFQSLHDMLATEDINRIKECPRCGWVFVDHTRNGKRRWCDPVECGTADKMQRYHAKRKTLKEKN
jgi:predicted RNA-binding Zn ribbon-like protein